MSPLFLILLFSCKQNNDQVFPTRVVPIDNQELIEIYNDDQGDRSRRNAEKGSLYARDTMRMKRVYELLDSNKVITSNDYQNAAMIFQHGQDSKSYEMAIKLMHKSIELDSAASKWLLAAATDRYLLSKNEPQIYGTQYSKTGTWEHPWQLDKIDTTKISDAERIDYSVETLAQQRENVKRMNRKKISDLLYENKSIDEIIRIINSQSKKDAVFDISEKAINSFGYILIEQKRYSDAVMILKLNTGLYSNSFKTWDSYGECLLQLGMKEDGIKAYKKSLELNPENEHAVSVLSNL